MELFILRHGLAEEVSDTGKDRDRALTDEGIERTCTSGKAFKRLGMKIDLILSSPFTRAWQTAEIVANELDCREALEACDALASGGSPQEILHEVKRAARKHSSILLVGHEPDLSRLISALISGAGNVAISMKKGGLCKLSCSAPEPGKARLEWLLTTKHLCRIA